MTVHIVGIPSFSGALYSGTEMTPAALRTAGLVDKCKEQGIACEDKGDITLPPYLPRHNIAPVRNWPAPGMVWDAIRKEAQGWFQTDTFTLIIGGDCSVIVGTADSLQQIYGEDAYLIVLDGHVDVIKPDASRTVGAAGMGLWFLTSDQDIWWKKTACFPAERIHILGCHSIPEDTCSISVTGLDELRQKGIACEMRNLLNTIPPTAKILLHFDVDVCNKEVMSSAYSPSDRGLSLEEVKELLLLLLKDKRAIALEVTEFSGIRDMDGSQANQLAQLLADVLTAR
ncbi:arginase family protein [Brevibacillus sp. SYSU BS000544]|uniref:arginase family protein n=1 Tax=Brevibacillus sp. SYSU BS000544 TaxID=3416443 RepID=UPI003CE5611E